MKKIIFAVIILACFWTIVVVSAADTCGVSRWDLVGKRWDQLPPSRYPGFGLPLPWKTTKKYELRLFEPDFDKYIVTVIELSSSGQGSENEGMIVSAVDFSTLRGGQYPEQDCFYRNTQACDGRLCDGLLIGVIDQKVISKNGTYVPTEVWKITAKSLRFEKVSPKNVICKPQSYAE